MLSARFFHFQTCYEMEKYLKDEPKLKSYKKLPSELDSAAARWKSEPEPDDGEYLFSSRDSLDSLSVSSGSSANWETASVKTEEPESESDSEMEDAAGRLLAHSLTPPSSPEWASAARLALRTNRGVLIHEPPRKLSRLQLAATKGDPSSGKAS